MSPFQRGLRQALTIARRDFSAVVMTLMFLFFLLSPLIMIGFGVVGGMSASTAASGGEDKERMVVLAPAEQKPTILAVDRQLRSINPDRWAPLIVEAPTADAEKQARALFNRHDIDVSAALYGPLSHPHILKGGSSGSESRYLAQLAEQVLRADKAGGASQLSVPQIQPVTRTQVTSSGKGQSAYFAAFGIFFLTLMLSGQVVGAMAEERSNKVIEVLAAAVPLESVFFGKLIGAFGSALLFVGFWGTLLANLPKLLPPSMASGLSELGTAVGPVFPLLFVAYFTMAYMLQSAVFLGVGSLASSQREIQMMSLPITIFQFAMLGLASYAAGHPGTWVALVAEIFPFSSPLAMAAHAANAPELWPHLLALPWQALWVAGIVTLAARVFRRGVLKSGSPKLRRKKVVAA